MACEDHPTDTWDGACRVQLGKKHTKRFKTVIEAEDHLIEINQQYRRGSFDVRDWQKAAPLSFLFLRKSFIISKEKKSGVKPKQIRHITYVLEVAGKFWDNKNIKDIAEGEIEDFLDFDHRKIRSKKMKTGKVQTIDDGPVGNNTLSKWRSVLHDFWKWVVRREKKKSKLEMPEFPDIKFEMEMKNVVNLDDQAAIIEEVKRITWEKNPRIWLGIWLMSWYPKVRPGEMLNLQEGHINLAENWILFPHPKEKNKPKFIHLLPEHSEIIREVKGMIPATLPDVFFFRHLKTKSGVKAGVKFGPKYFNIWWKKACANLGIEGVSVYPGVKHSTVTALGKIMSPEQIQHDITGHVSNAFKRYFLPDVKRAVVATRQLADMRNTSDRVVIEFSKAKKEAK